MGHSGFYALFCKTSTIRKILFETKTPLKKNKSDFYKQLQFLDNWF